MKDIREYMGSSSGEQIDEALVEEKAQELADMIKEGRLDEGVLGGIIGGLAGLTCGSAVMKAVCRALGVSSRPLYNLLTSKLVCTAAGIAVGKGA